MCCSRFVLVLAAQSAVKTNCLSKTSADAVLKAAAEKKGLKNKIVLQASASARASLSSSSCANVHPPPPFVAVQTAPVQELIKNAPYKSIDEAIVKIKGIGPVNVVCDLTLRPPPPFFVLMSSDRC
jgi:hypothetical protein